jgi:dTDP-4-amino-4,6-dideoxygalactose transaminase
MDDFIPVANPKASLDSHKEEILKATQNVFESGRYILGENVEQFEKEFARYLGVSFCIGVACGTEALSLALKAVGVNPGDEVITVSHTSPATIAAIEDIGAVPVFIDIGLHAYCMDAYRIESAITSKTKAIVPVHIYGEPASIHQIMLMAKDFNLRVVEDCAQAVGAMCKDKYVGAFGDAAAFSFYPTKNLGAVGDGGAVATNNGEVAEAVRKLREYGWNGNRISQRTGTCSRLDELQAAILRTKLPYLSANNQRRYDIAQRYLSCIDEKKIITQKSCVVGNRSANHLFVVRSAERFELKRFLNEKGIGTGFHYRLPVHLHPAYIGRFRGSTDLPETERLYNEILTLPMYPELTSDQIERICSALSEWISLLPITWEEVLKRDPVRLYAGELPPLRMEYDQGFIGLDPFTDEWTLRTRSHINQDITRSMPIPDDVIDCYVVEDVFEHIEYEKLYFTMDEVFRVLKPGGLLRLALPDYRYDFHLKDVVRDGSGKIIFDPKPGGTIENPEHKWFPVIENVRQLIENSRFQFSNVEYLHYYNKEGNSVMKPIDYSRGFVWRTPDNWIKLEGVRRPISIVVDLVK